MKVDECGSDRYIKAMSAPVLAIADVRKTYGSFPALNGVSFHVQPGELFGLLGPNGAGKTTLMSILAGLTPATSGQVKLFGQSFTPKEREARKRIGLATQDLAVYPELTARENLMFFGKLYGMRGRDLAVRVNEMLAAVGLSDRANHRVGTFSGGMKRRLNLAVALVHRPQLLLLDEPTTGVDPQSRNHIFEQVRTQNAAGLTVIYTSHYMEEVQTLCPRIAILDGGQVQACDTLPHLLQRMDATVKLTLPNPAEEVVEQVQGLPGVKRVNENGKVLEVTATELPPLLPKLLAVCGEVSAIEIEQPNLERVFLALTGRELRD
jgi:ABC-2 type transport system ATP-binding protein